VAEKLNYRPNANSAFPLRKNAGHFNRIGEIIPEVSATFFLPPCHQAGIGGSGSSTEELYADLFSPNQ